MSEGGIDLRVINYPPDTDEATIQMVMFGGSGPVRMLLEMDADEDDSVSVTLVLDLGAETDQVQDYLQDVISLLTVIVESGKISEALS